VERRKRKRTRERERERERERKKDSAKRQRIERGKAGWKKKGYPFCV